MYGGGRIKNDVVERNRFVRKKVTQLKTRYEGSLEEKRKDDRFNECVIKKEILKQRNVKNK